MRRTIQILVLFMLSAALLAGCGGSGGSLFAPFGSTTEVTGTVYASSVAGGTVVVLNSSGTTTIAGPVTTGLDGTYRIDIPSDALSSDLIISSTSGTFTDEATGAETAAGALRAYLAGGSLSTGSHVSLDPSSTVIAELVTAGAGTTLTEARSCFTAAFGYAPDTSIAPSNGPSTGPDVMQRLAALRAGAFSQLTRDLGLGPEWQFPLLRALGQDLADDGSLNGSAGQVNGTGLGIDIVNRFERSLVSFLTNTTTNLTALTTAEIGALPFGKVALTDSYRVEYIPMGMGAKQGKTAFKLKITDLTGTTPVTGLLGTGSLRLMPMMHMASMQHSTPAGTITETTPGEYACTVYYLMASGPGMGYWELKVMIGSGMMGETATFYPAVGMAMGPNTVRATLKGQSDNIISSMTETEKRSYYLFRDGLSGTTGDHVLDLFIAAKQSMMSYPAVSIGTLLSSPTGTVTAMTVQASSDNGLTWLSAADNGNGHWSVPGIADLVTGNTGTIFVKLNVNSEDKTTDGNAASGANAYATFVVTP